MHNVRKVVGELLWYALKEERANCLRSGSELFFGGVPICQESFEDTKYPFCCLDECHVSCG